jgi:RNA polymerase sigma-70 factor (ECF subfamily)
MSDAGGLMSESDPTDGPIMAQPDTDALSVDTDLNTAFEAFYRKNTKPLVAFLLLQGASLVDATDIVQDTMTAAYRRWPSITHPRAWAYRVASRALVRLVSSIREDHVIEPPQPNPLLRDTNIEQWEQHQDIIGILGHLPPRQRQVMAWTLSSYTPSEIANELNMTPEAVRSTLLKARQALRILLQTKSGGQ